MHTLKLFDDILAERTGILVRSMKAIGAEGNGIVVIIRGAQDPFLKDMVGSRIPGERARRSRSSGNMALARRSCSTSGCGI